MVSYGCCLLFEDYYKYSVMSYGFVNLGFLWFLMDIVCELTIIINIQLWILIVNRGYVCIIVYILSYEYTYCEFRILMISNGYCL